VSDAARPSTYTLKAERALKTARLLLTDHDPDGACNRAYYAMFDAAHAALFAIGVEEIDAPIKTHNGLIALFGQHVVRPKHLDSEYGVAFNKVENFRLVADYEGSFVSAENAAWAVERAEAFVAAIKEKFAL
jgi:uncharacterized protein (UPF0332 family)